jgi:putative acetyltransferase
MEIQLRQVQADDPQMLRLAAALRDEVEDRGAHNGAARPDIPLTEAIKADSDTLVAYSGKVAVGMGALRLLGAGTAEIKRMYVVPEYRGAGVARRILEELERRARARGLRAVRLDAGGSRSRSLEFP